MDRVGGGPSVPDVLAPVTEADATTGRPPGLKATLVSDPQRVWYFGQHNCPTPPPVVTIDVRDITNPHTTHAKATDEYKMYLVRQHPAFLRHVRNGVNLLSTEHAIAVRCAFGRHRSRAVAEEIGRRTGAVVERWPS